MTVYLGADHGGFELKEALKKHLDAEGYKVIDCGTDSTQSVDYAPIAEKTCLSVYRMRAASGFCVAEPV